MRSARRKRMSVEWILAFAALVLAVVLIGIRAALMPAEALDNASECPDEVEAPEGKAS